MEFTCGIIGLPNAGKSTIFNALSGAGAMMASYPFCTIEPNHAIVSVPDERLGHLRAILGRKNAIPTKIEFVDVAGLVKGASKGEGLGNKFLSHIRNVDALVHTVRLFDDDDVSHVMGGIDPIRDIDTINTELILSDLELLMNAREKLSKAAKAGDKKLTDEIGRIDTLIAALDEGTLLANAGLGEAEIALCASYDLITDKPVLYCVNTGDGKVDEQLLRIEERAKATGSAWIAISGKTEQEIAELPESERNGFRESMGIGTAGLDRLIVSAYGLLDLVTFYTMTTDLQAWTVKKGTTAPGAAGKIHSDFEKGFIRAEVVHYDDLVKAGSEVKARETGNLRSEGKEYVIRDLDVVHFLFNV
jgi:GTP-binding protein YchF